MSAKVLYSSDAVRQEIVRLFSKSRSRRVAISGFVGQEADAYLSKPKGLELYCWPKAGGTNPDTLRTLIQGGAKVYFADRCHMKVYWTADLGSVVTSANLSCNALGIGDLREAGVLLGPGVVEIDRLIKSLKARLSTDAELKQLDRKHAEFFVRNKLPTDSTTRSFLDWFELPSRPEWRLGWWDADSHYSKSALRIARDHGLAEPNQLISCKKNQFLKNGWVLSFMLSDDRLNGYLSWMHVDEVVRVNASEKKVYESANPYQAIQIWPKRNYPPPPFDCRDRAFARAFKMAVKEYGIDRIKETASLVPTNELITKMIRLYQESA